MEAATLDPGTAMGAVRLRVADVDRARDFYSQVVGLRPFPAGEAPDGVDAALGAGNRRLVELVAAPSAPERPAVSAGLFHLALLVSDRAELARAVRRVAGAGHRFTGASDHLVSEAVYLHDPEGNGIEIYRDRERSEWPREDGGGVKMATLPLDLTGLMAEAGDAGDAGGPMADDTRMGHVHLNVGALEPSEAFYVGALGFEVMLRWPPSALFVAAGGYHHHLGLNTWRGEGAPAPPEGSLGLAGYEVTVPSEDELERVAARLEAAGVQHSRRNGTVETSDPSGNRALIRSGGS